jgi:hypothetical protein
MIVGEISSSARLSRPGGRFCKSQYIRVIRLRLSESLFSASDMGRLTGVYFKPSKFYYHLSNASVIGIVDIVAVFVVVSAKR